MSRPRGIRIEWRRVARLLGVAAGGALAVTGIVGMQRYHAAAAPYAADDIKSVVDYVEVPLAS